MKDNYFLAEVNIATNPYCGSIVNINHCLPQKMTFLAEESPIAISKLIPGEIILCEKEPIYTNSNGEVFKVLRKFSLEELIDFLIENPSIDLKCWDYGEVSPYKIARGFFPLLKKMNVETSLSQDEVGLLIQSIIRALRIPNYSYIFPKEKLKIYELIIGSLNPAFKSSFLEILYKKKLIVSGYEILLTLFPILSSSIPEYICSSNAHKEMIDVIHNKWPTEVKLKQIRKIFLEDIESWLYLSGTDEINFELLAKSDFATFAKKVLEIRKTKVKNTTVFYKGRSKKVYDISALRETTLGKKLLQSLKVSESRKWINQHLFDLIEITFRKFKIKINLEKVSR